MIDAPLRTESLLGSSWPAWVVFRVDLLHDADYVDDLILPAVVYPSERAAAAATDRLNQKASGRARYFYRPTRFVLG